jgi:hypothetical protein
MKTITVEIPEADLKLFESFTKMDVRKVSRMDYSDGWREMGIFSSGSIYGPSTVDHDIAALRTIQNIVKNALSRQ